MRLSLLGTSAKRTKKYRYEISNLKDTKMSDGDTDCLNSTKKLQDTVNITGLEKAAT